MWMIERKQMDVDAVLSVKAHSRSPQVKCKRPVPGVVNWWEVSRPEPEGRTFVCHSAEDAAWLSSVLAEYDA